MKAKDIKSKVMTIANALVKQGASRSVAMVRAWITVKLHRIDTKTTGVTHGNRQKLLARLSRYSPDEITIKLNREPENAADKNAVQVIAAVKGKGAAVMGYLNRHLAAAIAPLMDKGKAVASAFLFCNRSNTPFCIPARFFSSIVGLLLLMQELASLISFNAIISASGTLSFAASLFRTLRISSETGSPVSLFIIKSPLKCKKA